MTASIPLKHCPDCGNDYSPTLEYFHVAKDTHDRLRAICKKCKRASDHQRYIQAKEQLAKTAIPNELFCPECENLKPIVQFHKNPTGRYGVASCCKDCAYKRTKIDRQTPQRKAKEVVSRKRWYQDNRKHCAQSHKQWYQDNREYALEKDRQFRIEHPEILAQRWQNWYRTENGKERSRTRVRNRQSRRKGAQGNYTHTDIQRIHKAQKGLCYYCHDKLDKYHIEHVVPITRGGSNDPSSNIVLACSTCNLKKGTKLPHEWPEGGRLM